MYEKIFFLFVLIFILAFQSFTVGVFASDLHVINTEEIQSESISKNIGGAGLQPMGIKIRLARVALIEIATSLRSMSTTILNSKLIAYVTTTEFRNVMINNSYMIASYLEQAASRFNAAEVYTQTILRNLIAQAGLPRYVDQIASFIIWLGL